jgi:hypothetical protein
MKLADIDEMNLALSEARTFTHLLHESILNNSDPDADTHQAALVVELKERMDRLQQAWEKIAKEACG